MRINKKEDIERIIMFFNENQPIIKEKEFKTFKAVYEYWINSNRNV